MTAYVSIYTRAVGQSFGTEAYCIDAHTGTEVYVTRLFPYNFDGAALQAARETARCRGWTVINLEGK